MAQAPALGARKDKGVARINAVGFKSRRRTKSPCNNKRRGHELHRFMPGIPWTSELHGNFAIMDSGKRCFLITARRGYAGSRTVTKKSGG